MSLSLFTGLAGLRAFETSLDVVGNNIANSNTVGYRSGRTTFGDLLSITISPGSAPSGTVGGQNPSQLGLGVGVKSIDIDTNSGSILATDRNLDLTIFGPGFFVVNNGSRDLYTRAGTFGFDANGTLVDLGTGYMVKSTAGSSIVVSPTEISLPQSTSAVTLQGNLPATVHGPLPAILETTNPLNTGTAALVSGTKTGPFALANGDSMTIQVDGGSPQTITFQTADFVNIAAATDAEIAAVINAQTSGVTATANGGAVDIQSDSLGASSSVKLTDVTSSPAFTLGLQTVAALGTETAATSAADLNALVTTSSPYQNGDGITISGIQSDGTEFEDTFIYGTTGTTVADLTTFIQAHFSDATVAFGGDGKISLTADNPGVSKYALSLDDAPGNVGSGSWSGSQFVVQQPGTAPDEANSAITVYDKNGDSHILALKFERVDALEWKLTASLPDDDGLVLDSSVTNIRFNSDGSLQNAGGTSTGDPNIELQFAGGNQTIDLNFGTSKSGTSTGTDGITQFGGPATAQATFQNGYAAGTLADVTVTEDGAVRATFTNGQSQIFGTLALANFANPGGLRRQGNNMFEESVNSGIPNTSPAGGAGGTIQSGVLESSNVDLAQEFVRMIEAQRGYQASARVIRASEELLNSLLQNI